MIKHKIALAGLLSIFLIAAPASAQYPDMKDIRCGVDFSKKIRDWDGFGFNYVETAQTMDYGADPQEYGGFSLLDDAEKAEIIDLVFGDETCR